MKNHALKSSGLAVFVRLLLCASQGTSADLNDGLAAYYPFDGNVNANDVSINYNHCTVHGATLTQDRLGNADSAYHFDGTAYLECKTPVGLPVGSQPRTMSAWIYREGTSVNQCICHYGRVADGQMFGLILSKNAPNRLYFWGYGWPGPDLSSSATVALNIWTFVAVTYDGDQIRLYVDGQEDNSHVTSLNTVLNQDGLRIGFRADYPSYWMGVIDDVRIYTRALSSSEIMELYHHVSFASIASPTRSGSILAGDALRFAACTDAAGGRVQYQWDFGDGMSSTLEVPGLITYSSPGEKVVKLNATLDQHELTPTTRTITVAPDVGSVPDLAVTQLNVPASLAINQPAEISYSVQNIGQVMLSGKSWTDAIYLSRDPYLDVNDLPLSSSPVSYNVAVGGSYTNSMPVTIPTVEDGAYSLLLSVDDEWEVLERHQLNNEFAVATDLVIPRLADGVSTSGRFTASGETRYYRIDVPSGQNLLVRLDDLDDQGANEIYVRFGSLPTRGSFNYRANVSGRADQDVLVPAATSGTWYVMVYGASVSGEGDFTLEAIFSQLKITGVVPNSNPSTTEAVLAISGAGFYGAMAVELVAADATAYPGDAVEIDSFSQITATFAADSVPAGVYSIRISRGGDSDTLANAFEVLSAGEAKLETDLIVPSQLGYHGTATIYVEYRNAGNASMPAPLLVLTATQNGREAAFLTLQAVRLMEGFWTSAEPEGFSHSIQILASGEVPGVLQPGESFRVPVYYAGWQQPWNFSYPPFHFSLGVLKTDDTTPVNWSELKSEMKPSSMSSEAWDATWATLVAQLGNTWGDYVKMLGDNARYLGRLGQRVVDVGQLLAFEFLQADGLNPLRSLASATDAGVEAPGLPLVFTRSFPEAISQRVELGPLGRGWSHNWQRSLQSAADGTVTILGPGGSRRVFQPDSRSNNYFAQPGDRATLSSLGGGAFALRETSGVLRVFRPDGKLNYIEDPHNNRITANYSGDLLASLTHSSGQSLGITYNAAGRIQSVTDHLGRQTQFSYDNAGEHLTGVQYYDGRTATYAYNAGQGSGLSHALTEVAKSCCSHQHFTYDAQGRLTGTHLDGNAQAVTFAYDSTGKVTATDALGHARKFYFDHRGWLVKTEDARGNAVHRAFDDHYNVVSLTDPAGRSYSYGYDSRGNLVRSTDPLGHVTRFTFTGPFDRLASRRDANGNLTRYAYTVSDDLQSITYADGSQESWTYDELGNRITWTNRRSRSIGYAYDPSGRIISKNYADGSQVTYSYDHHGNPTNAADAAGSITLEFNDKDQLIKISYPGGKFLMFTYDASGRRASSVDQLGHLLTYGYNAAGQLESMMNGLGQTVVRYEYDAAGRLVRKTLGNGVYTTYEYDPTGRVLHLVNFNADDSVLSRFDYSYDNRGRRTFMDTLDGKWTYEYDDLGQLTHAVFSSTSPEIPSQDLTYVYDAVGNRIRTIENGATTEYTVNNMSQYVQMGDTDCVFDADGNLIQEITPSGTTTYTYNDENRLIAVSNGADSWEYGYDALNNRVATTENGATTRYVIDLFGLGNVVGEYDGSGSLIAHYDHGLGLLSRTDAAGGSAYYTFDAIGNVHQLVTVAGLVANAYAYTPFGTLLRATEALPNSTQFVGEHGAQLDATGLGFMRARYFDPAAGRYNSEDPIGLAGGSLNLYQYAKNSPTIAIDPSGLDPVLDPNVGGHCHCDGTTPSIDLNLSVLLDSTLYFCTLLHEEIHAQQCREGRWGEPDACLEEEAYRASADCAGWATSEGRFWGGKEDENRKKCHPDPPPPPNPPSPPAGPGPGAASAAVQAHDPNQKIGPAGFGTGGFIAPTRALPYRIDFENEPSATAPAQQVVITDQLGANLDWGTFQWTEIGFGDQLIVVPPNTQYFETTVPVSCLDTDFEVQVEVGLRSALGQAYAVFRSIDPATSLPPPANIGFLPPEDGTGRGRGHISYTVSAKGGLETGAEVRNVAQISFDCQPVIATNQKDPHDPTKGTDAAKECLNTIDADPPGSAVAALPASTCSQFLVCWSGDDAGAGVASYDIYVSDSGGEWTLWLAGATETSARYEGQVGHTYAFYSIARDNVGHIESPPAQADATTTTTVRLHVISVLYSQGAQLTWASSPGETYTVRSCTDLLSGTWNVAATVPSQGQVTNWHDSDTMSTRKFYRIELK